MRSTTSATAPTRSAVYFPIRIASVLGLVLSLLGFVYAALVIFLRVVKGYQPEGWASLMVVVLVVSGVQLFIMGILGEYLWRTLDVARRRPQFVVERVLGFPSRESEASAPATGQEPVTKLRG